jgi:hypothetical protein
MRCVIHLSSYGMSMFKGLYNKILAIKKLSGKTFGKSSECCLTEDRQKYELCGFSWSVSKWWLHARDFMSPVHSKHNFSPGSTK